METHRACLLPERTTRDTAERGAIAVSEDPFIRKYLRDLLVRHGYRVVGAQSAQIIDLLRSGSDQIDLVITNSPGDFLAFADRVPLVYMAAVPDMELASLFPSCSVISKPFPPERLLAAINNLIGPL